MSADAQQDRIDAMLARRDDVELSQEVRDRSAEAVSLCKQRMAMEGLNRAQLEEIAKAEA